MSRVSVDANVMLRLILHDIPAGYESAKRLFSDLQTTVSISDAAIIEYVFALQHHYQMDRSRIAETLEFILSLPTVQPTHDIALAALKHYVSHPKLSYTDCYLAEHAQATEATPLWTFDKKLATQHEAAQLLP
jgi:predicted nucleic acid-binding protein